MFESGICIYEESLYEISSASADTQIFSGFITAIGSFAVEALGSNLQSIQLQTGEQMALIKHKESKLLGICIADGRDHAKLLSNLLVKILDRFFELYKQDIKKQDGALFDKTKSFKNEIKEILKNKTMGREYWKMFLGIIAGFGILAFLIFLSITKFLLQKFPGPLFIIFINNPIYLLHIQSIGSNIGSIFALLMFFVAFLFLLPAFISGYLAGSRIRALFAGLIIVIGAFLVLGLGAIKINEMLGLDLRSWFLAFSPLIFFLTLTVAFTAGYLVERLKLFSFEEPGREKRKLTKIFIAKKD
ncbi:MAG: hypothetical protein ACTSR3_14730 [Candidatus Helarchaeota archaeon]